MYTKVNIIIIACFEALKYVLGCEFCEKGVLDDGSRFLTLLFQHYKFWSLKKHQA